MMLAQDYYLPQVINVALAFFLLLFTASYLCLNVFTVPVEQEVPSFTSLWTRALGFASIVDSCSILLTVSLINVRHTHVDDEPHPITKRLKLAAFPISLCYLCLSLTVPALKYGSKTLLYLGVIPQIIPCGVFYLVSIRALTSWIPKYPALAMTFLSASYGVSQFIFSPILNMSISLLGLHNALLCTSFSLFFCVCTCAFLLRFPTANETERLSGRPVIPQNVNDDPSQNHDNNMNEESNLVLPWYEIIKTKEFYKYISVVSSGRAAMALFPYFFKLGSVFHLPSNIVVIIFQVLSLSAIMWSLIINSFYEFISKYTKSPVRPLLFVVFMLQSLLYATLIPISIANYSYLSMIIVSFLIIMLESQTAFAVILAQHVFGTRNGVVVYGMATGIAIGPAEGFFTTLMSLDEVKFSENGKTVATTFIPFYCFASICLLIGGIMLLLQTKCHKAFHFSSVSNCKKGNVSRGIS